VAKILADQPQKEIPPKGKERPKADGAKELDLPLESLEQINHDILAKCLADVMFSLERQKHQKQLQQQTL